MTIKTVILLFCTAIFAADGLAQESHDFDTLPLVQLEANAQKGNPQAQLAYAYRLETGRGIARNTKEARVWLQKAAEADLIAAQKRLAGFQALGIGGKIDHKSATHWYRKAALSGDLQARAAWLLRLGNASGVEKAKAEIGDFAGLISQLRKAAENDDTDAQYLLGSLLKSGLYSGDTVLLQADPRQARRLLRLAYPRIVEQVERGEVGAILTLPLVYDAHPFANKGIQLALGKTAQLPEQDGPVLRAAALIGELGEDMSNRRRISKAIKPYAAQVRAAAEQGDPTATVLLGTMRILGLGVRRDADKGIAMVEDISRREGLLDYTAGASLLAYVYSGEYKRRYRDDDKLVDIMRWSARTGNAEAQLMMGISYLEGSLVKQNFAAGLRLLSQAAEANNSQAQITLALVLLDQIEEDETKSIADLVQGYTWYAIAERNGIENMSHEVLKHIREFYEKALTLEQRRQAIRNTDEFLAEFQN